MQCVVLCEMPPMHLVVAVCCKPWTYFDVGQVGTVLPSGHSGEQEEGRGSSMIGQTRALHKYITPVTNAKNMQLNLQASMGKINLNFTIIIIHNYRLNKKIIRFTSRIIL